MESAWHRQATSLHRVSITLRQLRSLRFIFAPSAVFLVAACASIPTLDSTGPEPLAAQMAGLSGEIEFHAEGAPDDVAGAESSALRLGDAIEAAVRNDPKLQQALARWHKARAESEGARVLPNPVLSLGVGFGLTRPAKVDIGLTQQLLAYFQRPHRVGAADARLRAAAEDVLEVALNAVAEVRARYLALQAAEVQVSVLEERRSILTELRDFERLKLEHGEGVRADVTSFDAERAVVSVELADREAELREGRLVLARMIGRPSSGAAWTLDPWKAPTPPTSSEAAWIARALARRPEIRALGWELTALSEERALAGTWNWDGAGAGAGAQYDDGVFLGPSIDVPLPLRDVAGPRDAVVAAAEAEVCNRITETRRRVIEEVRTAWAACLSAQRALDRMQTEVMPLLEQRRVEARAACEAGEGDLAALLLAEQALAEARTRRVALEVHTALSGIHLERAAAGPAPDGAPGPPGGSVP